MFLFHGTKGHYIDSIRENGLVPPSKDDLCSSWGRWKSIYVIVGESLRKIVSGPGPAVFLSNLPRAGPASDPLGYSKSRYSIRYGYEDGYLVVVECDQSYLEERLFGIWTSIDVDTFLGFGKFRESSRVGDLEDFLSRKLTHPTVDCQYLTTGIDADKIFDIFKVYDGRQKRLLPEFNPKFHHRLSWKRKNFATLVWKRVLKLKKERSRRQR